MLGYTVFNKSPGNGFGAQTERGYIMNTQTVQDSKIAMETAANAFNIAYRANADKTTLSELRSAHQAARSAWLVARANAGDTVAAVQVAIGA